MHGVPGRGLSMLFYGIQGDTVARDVAVDLLFLFLFQLTIC